NEVRVPVELGETYTVNFGDSNNTDRTSIFGTVFEDRNVSGEWDIDEPGLAGVTVSLKNVTGTPEFFHEFDTNEWGQFTFSIDTIGNYTLNEMDLPGYVSTNAIPGSYQVSKVDASSLAVDARVLGIDLGNNLFGDVLASDVVTITGQVVNDTNDNGQKDLAEDGLAGANITLSSGMYQITGSNGQFTLYGPPNLVLNIIEINPQGYRSTNAIPGDSAMKIDNDTVQVDSLVAGTWSNHTIFLDTLGEEKIIGIDVEKYVLVNESGTWVRYDGELDASNPDLQIPILQNGTDFKWEIWVKNNGTMPVDLTWDDINDGMLLNLDDVCPDLPSSLDRGVEYNCTFTETALVSTVYTYGNDISFGSALRTNQVFVEAEYDGQWVMDEDSATYLVVENPFGVKKLVYGVENGSLGLFDANTPPGPTVYTSIPMPAPWVVLVWNFYNEPAILTWTDEENGTVMNLHDIKMLYGSVPDVIPAYNVSYFWYGTPYLGLNYNNVTITADFLNLPDETVTDIAYYTGKGLDLKKYVLVNETAAGRFDADIFSLSGSGLNPSPIPFIKPGDPFSWEISARNPGKETLNLTWQDTIMGIPFNNLAVGYTTLNLSDACPEIPDKLAPGDPRSCRINDTAQDGIFINIVTAYDGDTRMPLGYDTAAYFG
ncbi:MAG TPA: SdrD B-like domain-containing protein, partial [Methanomicrobiales archaeon]|nr:SdrD B-like domain-containing protein [Methanomicrobiales archaeon]